MRGGKSTLNPWTESLSTSSAPQAHKMMSEVFYFPPGVQFAHR